MRGGVCLETGEACRPVEMSESPYERKKREDGEVEAIRCPPPLDSHTLEYCNHCFILFSCRQAKIDDYNAYLAVRFFIIIII